jgi:hypothetical protein
MDLEEAWEKALKNTEIIRGRLQALMTMADTKVPYILLSESSINEGDTVVRKGEVIVHKPALFIPPHNPSFQGFDFNEKMGVDENSFINFLLVRGVSLPSLAYDNKTHSLDIYEDSLSQAVKHYKDLLQRQENVSTGLLTGPEDCWPFSLMIFICAQILKNSNSDIRKLIDEYRKNNPDQNA